MSGTGGAGVSIRPFREADAEAAARIFHAAVHEGAAALYSEEQRVAWAPAVPDARAWAERLGSARSVVAERNGKVLGFMSLTPEGLIDLAFVAPEAMGAGIGRRLYEAIERTARNEAMERLFTDASLVARPFFARQGFALVRQQTVTRRGVSLTNFRMEKWLD